MYHGTLAEWCGMAVSCVALRLERIWKSSY